MDIDSLQARELLSNNKEIIVLDVRTYDEFELGYIQGAKLIDFFQPDFFQEIIKLDSKRTYLVYCRTQNRSGKTVDFMLENGFEEVYKMTDGFLGWYANNLPVEE